MVVSGIWHPSSNLVAGKIGDRLDVGSQDLLEAVQCASVSGPIISDRPGEGIKESGSLDGEAGFLQGLGFGAGFNCRFQDHPPF